MKTITVYFVQLPEPAREPSEKAVRETWPWAQVVFVSSVSEALKHSGTGSQLLVLGGPDEAEVGLAAQTLDGGDLPRWAVVCLGRGPAELAETVPPEDWNTAVLARAFRGALLQHELLRENLQLRGDLKTISRRIAHDSRTPLGCILTVCELLKDLPPENAESLKENTEVIRSSTNELSNLVDRLSFMLRATLDPTPTTVFAMGTAVEQVLQDLQPEIEASGKKVRQPAHWPEAEGVPLWVETVWANLIRNALVHGTKSGAIQLGWNREGEMIRFWVSSQGQVPTAIQPRLFRRFHQLHQQPSAGLSLSFSERLIALQGGRCGFEPAEENRSVFFFTLRDPSVARESGHGARHASLAGSGTA